MSRHESVSCDSCLKGNFRGKRYKCLICYDYDLCASCYEAGATTTRHTTDHPMQCILTRADFDIYYGGEAVGAEQPQAFTCPYCGKMGFTEVTLQEHVTTDHTESSAEVVCPICAALPGGDPNHVTDEFGAHLTLEHRAPRDFDEPMGSIRHVRRIPHPSRGGGGGSSSAASRTRRANMQFHTAGAAGLTGLSPGAGRDAMDPIAELLSQLSSVRSRAAAAQNVSSQLQQLEMQLQSTRSVQQLERLPRRQAAEANKPLANSIGGAALMVGGAGVEMGGTSRSTDSQYLLSRIGDVELSDVDQQQQELEHADRSVYVQELLLSSLADRLRLADAGDSDSPLLPADSAEDSELGGGSLLERSSSPRGGGGGPPAAADNCVKGRNKVKPGSSGTLEGGAGAAAERAVKH